MATEVVKYTVGLHILGMQSFKAAACFEMMEKPALTPATCMLLHFSECSTRRVNVQLHRLAVSCCSVLIVKTCLADSKPQGLNLLLIVIDFGKFKAWLSLTLIIDPMQPCYF